MRSGGRRARRPDGVHVDGIVSKDDGIGAQLPELLDEVVDEGIEIVDDQHPGTHGATSVPRLLRGSRRCSLTSQPVATGTRGPGGASRKGKSASGRTSKVGRYTSAEESGRYTAPIPKNVRHSPPWFGALLLVLLIGGVVVITVNYLGRLPLLAHGSPWGLVIGLVMIFAGFLLATRYR